MSWPLALGGLVAVSQASATTGGLPRFPDLSGDTVVFTSGGDLWTAPVDGGVARRLTAHPGVERLARFSPDGERIAYTADYDGNADVWVIGREGGVPDRLTYLSSGVGDNLVWGWTPSGDGVLMGSRASAVDGRYFELFTVGLHGGMPVPLATSDSGPATLAPDGTLIFNRKLRSFRTWKRYRGGMQEDLWRLPAHGEVAERLTTYPGTDTWPMPRDDGSIVFVSDRPLPDAEPGVDAGARNLFLRTSDGDVRPLTAFQRQDVAWPSLDGDRVVYQLGGDLRLFDLATGGDRVLDITIPDEALSARPQRTPLPVGFTSASPGPQGKRVAVVNGGDLFTVPAESGEWREVVGGSAGRVTEVAWSPDGNTLAFVSDRPLPGESVGHTERHVWLVDQSGREAPWPLETANAGWLSGLRWSPDGARLLWQDGHQRLFDADVATGEVTEVVHGDVAAPRSAVYSADGAWLAYVLPQANGAGAVWLYDVGAGTPHQITAGFDDDREVAWDPDGRWLYLLSRRHLDLVEDTLELRFVHRKTDLLYALTLRADGPDPIPPRSDEEVDDDGAPVFVPEPVEERRRARRRRQREAARVVAPATPATVDVAGLASRLVRLPVEPGRYRHLGATSEAVYFIADAPLGDTPLGDLSRYGLEEQEIARVAWSVQDYTLAAGGDKVLLSNDTGGLWLSDPSAEAGWQTPVSLDGLVANQEPRVEWARTLDEVHRYLREHFYDPGMHDHDWDALYERYATLLPRATDESDVRWLIGEMIGELDVGHAYVWAGWDGVRRDAVGRLGADLVDDGAGVRIDRILTGEPGDPDRTSPLRAHGVHAVAGEYLLAIDGKGVASGDNPHALLIGTVGRPVRLRLGPSATGEGARDVTVRPLASDAELRYWDWVAANRARVTSATAGRVGYVHVPDTSGRGYTTFMRGLAAQRDKDALIVDVRFNRGGYIPDLFVEPLSRPLLNVWVPRDGAVRRTPSLSVVGPKVMLTNGYAGSGGDALPYYFRALGLGPLVGGTTWGGLVGIEGSLELLIGGGVTAPSFGFVNLQGDWDVEREGVVPDLVVEDPPTAARAGEDPQLDAAIGAATAALVGWTSPVPGRPSAFPRRP